MIALPEHLGRETAMISLVKTIMGVSVGCSILFPSLGFCQDMGMYMLEHSTFLVESVAG